MALSTQPYKGARDFYPEDKRTHKWLLGKLRETVEKFGYVEYDAPLLEPVEIYAAKSGEELVNEQLYSFEDRGGRKVAIRPEMTPSVSRMVAGRRQELAYPVRWYSIPNLWRYERPQRGRLREHYQLNVDIFGVEGLEADAEIIHVADAIMKSLGAKKDMYKIKVNSRNLMMQRSTLAKPKNPDMTPNELLRILDRWNKDEKWAREQIVANFNEPEVIFGMMRYQASDATDSIFGESLGKLLEMLKTSGVESVEYDPTIARGFDYYTDIVFEVFDNNPENNRSMFGGGRYDGFVGLFGVEPVPTVGFGMGDVTLLIFLEGHGLLPELKSEVDAVVITIGDVYIDAKPLIESLRAKANVAVDFTDRKLDKKIQSAAKAGVKTAIFIGEDEVKSGQVRVKDLTSGDETTIKPGEYRDAS